MNRKYFKKEGAFALELGGELSELEICYSTYGQLNVAKDNVIWVNHALTANSEVDDWWAGLFGEGRLFDPSKYFIVCANNLGSPYGTTSANSVNPDNGNRYGLNFPEFTIRDSAKVHLQLMTHLNINEVFLLIGGSCGGNIALEMAITLKERLLNLCLVCSAPKESPWSVGIHQTQRNVLQSAPEFKLNKVNAGMQALEIARAIALPYYRTPHSINTKQQEDHNEVIKDFKVISYLNHQGAKFSARFDAQCYFTLLNALDTHNIGRNRSSIEDVLSQLETKTLVLAIDSDLFIPSFEQKFMAAHLPNGQYEEIKSIYGHDAFLIETDQINTLVKNFLT